MSFCVALVCATAPPSLFADDGVKKRRISVQNELGRGVRSQVFIRDLSGKETVVGTTNMHGAIEAVLNCPPDTHLIAKTKPSLYMTSFPRPRCKGEAIQIKLILIDIRSFDDLGNRYLREARFGPASIAFSEARYRAFLLLEDTPDAQRQAMLEKQLQGIGDRIGTDLEWAQSSFTPRLQNVQSKFEISLKDILREIETAQGISTSSGDWDAQARAIDRYLGVKTFTSVSLQFGYTNFFRFDPLQDKEVLSKAGVKEIKRIQSINNLPAHGGLDVATIKRMTSSDIYPVIKAAYAESEKPPR